MELNDISLVHLVRIVSGLAGGSLGDLDDVATTLAVLMFDWLPVQQRRSNIGILDNDVYRVPVIADPRQCSTLQYST